jgi:hypothetical protein
MFLNYEIRRYRNLIKSTCCTQRDFDIKQPAVCSLASTLLAACLLRPWAAHSMPCPAACLAYCRCLPLFAAAGGHPHLIFSLAPFLGRGAAVKLHAAPRWTGSAPFARSAVCAGRRSSATGARSSGRARRPQPRAAPSGRLYVATTACCLTTVLLARCLMK